MPLREETTKARFHMKSKLALTLAAVATLAACGGYETVTPVYSASATAPAVVVAQPAVAGTVVYPSTAYVPVVPSGAVGSTVILTQPLPLRPGFGKVDGITMVVNANNVPTGMRRLSLRMDDGSFQVVDTTGPAIAVGERVEITMDSMIRYPLTR
jgi:hypothetical protein